MKAKLFTLISMVLLSTVSAYAEPESWEPALICTKDKHSAYHSNPWINSAYQNASQIVKFFKSNRNDGFLLAFEDPAQHEQYAASKTQKIEMYKDPTRPGSGEIHYRTHFHINKNAYFRIHTPRKVWSEYLTGSRIRVLYIVQPSPKRQNEQAMIDYSCTVVKSRTI